MDKRSFIKHVNRLVLSVIPEFILESSDSCSSDVHLVVFVCILREVAFGFLRIQFILLSMNSSLHTCCSVLS